MKEELEKVTTLEDAGLTEEEFEELRYKYLEDRIFDQLSN